MSTLPSTNWFSYETFTTFADGGEKDFHVWYYEGCQALRDLQFIANGIDEVFRLRKGDRFKISILTRDLEFVIHQDEKDVFRSRIGQFVME